MLMMHYMMKQVVLAEKREVDKKWQLFEYTIVEWTLICSIK